jgi:hypothetical protein
MVVTAYAVNCAASLLHQNGFLKLSNFLVCRKWDEKPRASWIDSLKQFSSSKCRRWCQNAASNWSKHYIYTCEVYYRLWHSH